MFSLWIHSKSVFQRILFFVLFAFVCTNISWGNNKEKEDKSIYQSISGAYIFGGQVYNDNFIYNPGWSFFSSVGKFINKDVAVGLGSGFMGFEDVKFLPIYAEVIGNKKSKPNSPFIKMQFGYSVGWNNSFPKNIDYEYSGGAFIDIGMGRKIMLNDNYALLFQWSYRHQFAKMEYETYGSGKYSQNLNYDMITLSLGILFRN